MKAVCLLALVAATATGCGGINASKSISPLDFIMPGLMQNHPKPPETPIETTNAPLIAQANPHPL